MYSHSYILLCTSPATRKVLEQHRAALRTEQPPDRLEQCGFAAPVGAEQRENLPFRRLQRDAVENDLSAVSGRELLKFKPHGFAS